MSCEEAMSEQEYQDREGNPTTLDKLCRDEPEWAANRIRAELSKAPPPLAERAELLALEPGSAYLMVITLAEPMKWRESEKFTDRIKRWLEVVRQGTGAEIYPIVFEGGVAVQFARVSPVRNITIDALDAMMAARFCQLIELALRRDHR